MMRKLGGAWLGLVVASSQALAASCPTETSVSGTIDEIRVFAPQDFGLYQEDYEADVAIHLMDGTTDKGWFYFPRQESSGTWLAMSRWMRDGTLTVTAKHCAGYTVAIPGSTATMSPIRMLTASRSVSGSCTARTDEAEQVHCGKVSLMRAVPQHGPSTTRNSVTFGVDDGSKQCLFTSTTHAPHTGMVTALLLRAWDSNAIVQAHYASTSACSTSEYHEILGVDSN